MQPPPNNQFVQNKVFDTNGLFGSPAIARKNDEEDGLFSMSNKSSGRKKR